MAEIILTTKLDLETIVHNSVLKALLGHGESRQEPKEEFFSLVQAAEFLKLAKQTLYGFTSKRKIPFIKKGKKLYFKVSDLEKWLETGRKKSKSEIIDELSKSEG